MSFYIQEGRTPLTISDEALCGRGLLGDGHVVGVVQVAVVLDGDGRGGALLRLGVGESNGLRVGVLEVSQVLPLLAGVLDGGRGEGEAGEDDGDEGGGLHGGWRRRGVV